MPLAGRWAVPRLRCTAIMKLLLTSSGVTNETIRNALVDLLGKPIEESTALIVPTAINPFPGGALMAWRAITGKVGGPLAGLGWKTLGVLELTVLPTIDQAAWRPTVDEADALLFWGGDPLYLSHWMRESGLAAVFPSLDKAVYVGVSAGSIAATATFGETYIDPPTESGQVITSDEVVFDSPEGEFKRILVTAHGVGLVDFALIPHFQNPGHPDASTTNAERWAARIPAATYAIDDQTAIKIVDGNVEVISEGRWRLFTPE
jgi:dipeptidase E